MTTKLVNQFQTFLSKLDPPPIYCKSDPQKAYGIIFNGINFVYIEPDRDLAASQWKYMLEKWEFGNLVSLEQGGKTTQAVLTA